MARYDRTSSDWNVSILGMVHDTAKPSSHQRCIKAFAKAPWKVSQPGQKRGVKLVGITLKYSNLEATLWEVTDTVFGYPQKEL